MLNSTYTILPTTTDTLFSTTNFSLPTRDQHLSSTILVPSSTTAPISTILFENASTILSPSSSTHPYNVSTSFLSSSTLNNLGNVTASSLETFQHIQTTNLIPSTTAFVEGIYNSTTKLSTYFHSPSTDIESTYSSVFLNNTNILETSSQHLFSSTSKTISLSTTTKINNTVYELLNTTIASFAEKTAFSATSQITSTNASYSTASVMIRDNSGIKTLDERLTPIEVFTTVMLVLLFFIGTIGNVLTIWVFLIKKKRKRKRFELLLSVLAITDLFSAIFIPLLFLYGTITKYNRWDMGYMGCKLISSLFPVSVSFSQGILLLISYDRYRSMSNPFGKPIRGTFIAMWIVVSFIISCALVSPYYYALELVTSLTYGINTCAASPAKFKQLYIYSWCNILRDVVATVALVVLGSMTNRALKSNGAGALFGSVSAFNKRRRNANKARKMLIVVACVFSMCVIPLDLFQVLVYTMVKLSVNINGDTYDGIVKANTFLMILQVANSSTNFIIYSRMNRNFMPQVFACIERGKHFTTSFRTTFRSTRSDSIESLSNTAAVILSVLPITPDSVFLPLTGGTDVSTEDGEAFHFPEPNNNNEF